jgi:hypothetical protein
VTPRPLHNVALPVVTPAVGLHTERHPGGLGEGLIHTAISHRGALQIPQGIDSPGDLETLVVGDHFLLLSVGAVGGLLLLALLAQIALEGDEDELCALAVLGDLGDPFGLDVLEGVLRVYAEAEHDGVGVVVGEGAEAVEFFLAGGVPQGEFDMGAVDEDVWRTISTRLGLLERWNTYHGHSSQRR